MKKSPKEHLGYYRSPLGRLRIRVQDQAITGIECVSGSSGKNSQALPRSVQDRLDHYFEGRPSAELFRFKLQGTRFQESVWNELRKIPWGSRVSYADMARAVKRPKAVRAVASAVGKNPIAILIPCHRVIGSDGSLRGYAYGLKKKAWLLDHEKQHHPARSGRRV